MRRNERSGRGLGIEMNGIILGISDCGLNVKGFFLCFLIPLDMKFNYLLSQESWKEPARERTRRAAAEAEEFFKRIIGRSRGFSCIGGIFSRRDFHFSIIFPDGAYQLGQHQIALLDRVKLIAKAASRN